MGLEERKVLVMKLKKRDDKVEVLKESVRLKGTKIYLEEDLTGEERKTQSKLLDLRRKIKEKDASAKVFVRNGRMSVNRKWYSLEEAMANFPSE